MLQRKILSSSVRNLFRSSCCLVLHVSSQAAKTTLRPCISATASTLTCPKPLRIRNAAESSDRIITVCIVSACPHNRPLQCHIAQKVNRPGWMFEVGVFSTFSSQFRINCCFWFPTVRFWVNNLPDLRDKSVSHLEQLYVLRQQLYVFHVSTWMFSKRGQISRHWILRE